MKLLVSAQRLQIGGTQTNAIEIAALLRDRHGFDPLIWAAPGPMLALLKKRELPFVAAPDVRIHPSRMRMRALRRLVEREKPDLIHAWDWWQALDAYFGVYLPMRVPLVVTDMMMDLTRVLPRTVPTTFGTPDVVAAARKAGWTRAELMLPPIDTIGDAPGVPGGPAFRQALGIAEDELAVISVSRLANGKTDGLYQAIGVVRSMPEDRKIRLVIVGDGTEKPALEALARDCNAHLGRPAVILTGSIIDPKPAYAAADIVLGMGGSALRAMSMAKPMVLLGEIGFAKIFSPDTRAAIHATGMYGWVDGDRSDRRLREALATLRDDAGLRAELGRFGRRYVVENYSLEAVTARFADFCLEARDARPSFGKEAAALAKTSYYYLRERRFWCPSRDADPRDEVVALRPDDAPKQTPAPRAMARELL